MPRIADTGNILSYYHESRTQQGRDFPLPATSNLFAERHRWPVRNRCDRDPIGPQKRALIHARDGHTCHHCGIPAYTGFVLDHIIPRSAFPADQLHIADRSDNLITSCWDCNDAKSNFEDDNHKRPGVTPACWYCLNAWADEDVDDLDREQIPELPLAAFCGRCGLTSRVPNTTWIL